MSDSICVGCRFARWDRDKRGRLARSGAGKCMGPDIPRVSLPAAFRLVSHLVEGGEINRRQENFDPWACHYRETTP